MDKIFEQAKDLHVVATMIYNNGDNSAYTDAECTKKFEASELKEAFIKGALISVNGELYRPVSYNGGINYVTTVTDDGTTTVSVVSLRAVASPPIPDWH